MDLTDYKNDLLFLPLGGSGEIGLNLNLYFYKGKWLMIDMGAGFADGSLPGVDMITPDISFIVRHKKDLLGIVLTHIHEDHLGGIQYLWDELRCPIFATKFTANFLRTKLTGLKFKDEIKIHEVECGGKISILPFTLELVPLTHSAPEMQAILIRTDLGNIFHTGDWKFDQQPLIGEVNDEKLLKQYGDEGVLALIGDSTNVFNPGVSGSEGDLRESLTDLIAKCKNLVAVTTFASNVARIETIIKAAEASGRHVVVAGTSLKRLIKTAMESGYLNDIEPYLEEKDIGKYPRHKLLLLCTGCQGEPLATTSKIAFNVYPHIKFARDDTIIFSSKIIPGNEKKIFKLFNQFVKAGIEVLTEKDHFVHVSGHPACDELKRMYELIKPKIAVPVHGELMHMHEHAKLARVWGVKQVIEVENGDIIRLAPNAEIIARVQAGYLAVDGNYLLPVNSPIMQMRRKMQREGIVLVVIFVDQYGNLMTKPVVTAPGLLDSNEDNELLLEISEELQYVLEDYSRNTNSNTIKAKKKHVLNKELLTNKIREVIRSFIKREVGKKPSIEIYIERCI
ncbi:MAG: ribonuclease J [Rickettsiales endosymbiont of Dermacentor nuttalli]